MRSVPRGHRQNGKSLDPGTSRNRDDDAVKEFGRAEAG
jgi:hypothetical protein